MYKTIEFTKGTEEKVRKIARDAVKNDSWMQPIVDEGDNLKDYGQFAMAHRPEFNAANRGERQAMKSKTISLRVKEYDRWDGSVQCVNNEIYDADWIGNTKSTVRSFLAGGDYSEGGEDRTVEVSIVDGDSEQYHASYSAPQIRRFKHRAGTK